MTNLIGTGKIVGLIELSSDYLYDFYSFSNKMADFSITVQKPPFVLVPHGGWSGAGRNLVKNILQKPKPTVAATVKTVRTFNRPIEAVKKLGQGYCLDTSLMLVEGDSKSLTKALTYAPRKVFRFALWGVTRKTRLGKIGRVGIACVVGSYEIYRLVCPTDTKIDAFFRGATFTIENFLTDTNVDKLGLEVCNRISSEAVRNVVCKIVLTK
jgi:hypothetical protein